GVRPVRRRRRGDRADARAEAGPRRAEPPRLHLPRGDPRAGPDRRRSAAAAVLPGDPLRAFAALRERVLPGRRDVPAVGRADDRLRESHDFWLATVTPGGRPHLMPVWAVWTGEVLWFSSSLRSVKARNIAAGSAVSIATEDPYEPVVVEGTAEIVTDPAALR